MTLKMKYFKTVQPDSNYMQLTCNKSMLSDRNQYC